MNRNFFRFLLIHDPATLQSRYMDKTDTFFIGVIAGVCLLAVLLSVSTAETPESIRNSAVSAGVAEWIVSYDSNGSPALKFRWKTTNQVF